jgi:hypothetical protein
MEFGVVKRVWLASILSSSWEIFLNFVQEMWKTNYPFGEGRGAKNINVSVVHKHLNSQHTKKQHGWKKKVEIHW